MSSLSTLYILLFLCSLFSTFRRINSAGDADGRGQGFEGNKLHLNPGEKPRTEDTYGAGLHTIELTYDVVVAGGGSAGISAALSSARNGAHTIVIQSKKVFGGNAASESKLHMVGATVTGSRGKYLKTEARESGIIEEYTLDNCVTNEQRCAEMLDLTIYNLMKLESNLDMLLMTSVVACYKDPNTNQIIYVIAENQSTQLRYIIYGKVFIDSTGDGRLAVEANVPYIFGREGKDVYNESLAVPQSDNETEGSSFAFTSVDYGKEMPFTPPAWARKFNESDFSHGRSISNTSLDYGFWWIEISYPYNNIRDNNIIQDLLITNVMGIWDYIKNSGNYPNAKNRVLNWFEWLPCKRQGRRFIGNYVQTQNDILPNVSQTDFPPKLYWDRVAYGGWNLDLHNPKGIYDLSNPPYQTTHLPFIYSTPLSSLIASNVTNLFLAGRLASFSQVAFGSQRVMKTCSTHGQAVGTAAAYCIQNGVLPVNLTQNNTIYNEISPISHLWSIQQELLRDDAYIIGIYNEDYRDYARNVTNIYASSIYNDTINNTIGDPWYIISGQTRTVESKYRGAANGQYKTGINRWMSNHTIDNLLYNGVSWITLEWNNMTLKNICEIQLIFDTGLHRWLTLSQKESDQNTMIWGKPQPETVKNYLIEVYNVSNKKWFTIVNVENNYQRRNTHNVSSIINKNDIQFNKLRVNVTANNGCDDTRILEIRIYDNHGVSPFPKKL